jgi:hypothetical protein
MPADQDHHEPQTRDDWSKTFQAQARRTRRLYESVGCFGVVAIFVVFITLLLSSHGDGLPWYWAFVAGAAGVALLVWFRPAPWPDCPACGRSFRRLGPHCPHCGGRLPADATPTRADCPGCGYHMTIVGKAPCHNQKNLQSSSNRYRLVPVRYCTHCRARLGP